MMVVPHGVQDPKVTSNSTIWFIGLMQVVITSLHRLLGPHILRRRTDEFLCAILWCDCVLRKKNQKILTFQKMETDFWHFLEKKKNGLFCSANTPKSKDILFIIVYNRENLIFEKLEAKHVWHLLHHMINFLLEMLLVNFLSIN